ncbi:hypothetical protein [Virgisporangium aurantiacum]|nr:hypothetical protein [Virgisporangium aurantiacum]
MTQATTDPESPGEPPIGSTTGHDLLSPRGRTLRMVITAVGLAVLLAGTLFGTDDHFPFGPFRMFATTDAWSKPISIARAQVVDVDGRTIVLTEANSGVRRAEVEGQLDRFRREPAALAGLADAYRAHNPSAPKVARVAVVLRHHEISRSGPTGHYTDEVVAEWTA